MSPIPIVLCLLAAWPAPVPQDGAAVAERRARILDIARQYAELRWKAGPENALHGEDADGTHVDTPDTELSPDGWKPDGSENVGMPYAWGGFTSIEQFLEGLEEGRFAGHVPSTQHVSASAWTLGLDCSGFVSRCWDLPFKQSTRSLGALCYDLPGYDELRTGDILNKFDAHVVLFDEWADEERTSMHVYEAARLRVERSTYEVEALKRSGFVPMRYAPLEDRWVPMTALEATVELPAEGGRFLPGDGEPASSLDDFDRPLDDARMHEWVRYDHTSNWYPVPQTATRMVAGFDGDIVETQRRIDTEEGMLMRATTLDRMKPAEQDLIDFAAYGQPFQDVVVAECRVETGVYEVGEHRFPARRTSLTLEGRLRMRNALYPSVLTVLCVQSDEVPLQGILEAQVVIETDYSRDGREILSRNELGWRLKAYGVGSDDH